MTRLVGRWLCRHGHHDWREDLRGTLVDGRMFRRVGDSVRCRRGCGAVLHATQTLGWVVQKRESRQAALNKAKGL